MARLTLLALLSALALRCGGDDRDARMDFRVRMMKFNAQAAEEALAARKLLVATLTPEQKAALDRFGPGPKMRHGGPHHG